MSFAHQIEVFSTKALPVNTNGMEVTVCLLDEINQFESKLADVYQRADEAKTLVRQHERHLMNAFNCQYLASVYGIEKLPAVVIDKEYVAYSVDSVEKALEFFKNKAESHA